MATLKLLQSPSPAANGDRMFVSVTPEANYVQGTPDVINLSAIEDPQIIGQIPLNNPPTVTPGIFCQNIGGYKAEMVKGATLATYGMKFYDSGGNELASGAMPASIANGEIVLEIVVPTTQQD